MRTIEDPSVVVRVSDIQEAWPVEWTGVWVGTLAALASALIIGLAAVALGAHHVAPGDRILRWGDVGVGALVFTVLGAFFSFAIGGWVAARIAGTHVAESSTLHGVIVWLLAVPILVVFAALGAGVFFGGWYGGLAGTPVWVNPTTAVVDPNAEIASRNSALAALTALLIGLIGSVIGGWMGSGEPMSLRYSRRLDDIAPHRAGMRRSA
jgi:hypothetical protein